MTQFLRAVWSATVGSRHASAPDLIDVISWTTSDIDSGTEQTRRSCPVAPTSGSRRAGPGRETGQRDVEEKTFMSSPSVRPDDALPSPLSANDVASARSSVTSATVGDQREVFGERRRRDEPSQACRAGSAGARCWRSRRGSGSAPQYHAEEVRSTTPDASGRPAPSHPQSPHESTAESGGPDPPR